MHDVQACGLYALTGLSSCLDTGAMSVPAGALQFFVSNTL
jgi:hypothetical protein